eukprot:TRINITY_DN25922_c0_g1_i1.p1 TRINITY_DN25922_c0_g1~~TRINITY_DN25922_c0_g1_i1.p1  ORF type:complete len:550 (-),score=94.10 TRINITY_DN25922_c0_g1_i1:185-1834(-)
MDFRSLCENTLKDIRTLLQHHETEFQKKLLQVQKQQPGFGWIDVDELEADATPIGVITALRDSRNCHDQEKSSELRTAWADSPAKGNALTTVSSDKVTHRTRPSTPSCPSANANVAQPQIKMHKGVLSAGARRGDVRLDEAPYDVSDFYKQTGFAQSLARSPRFEKLTLMVIAINSVYIGVDADNNKAETLIQATWPYQMSDNLFCLFFFFEIMTRFCAFAQKRNCLRDAWFVFDACLVLLMVAETWVLTILLAAFLPPSGGVSLPTGPLRLLRLLRLSRLVRLLRALPELLTLVNGMRSATRAVTSSLILIVGINYVFAIIMNMFLREISESIALAGHFSTLGNTMWTLGLDGTFMDSTRALLDQLKALENHGYDWTLGWSMIGVFVAYILLTNITVMNMLIGVLCEVVSAVKTAEDEKVAIDFMKQHLRGMLVALDLNRNEHISKDELLRVVEIPLAVKVLEELEVKPEDLIELTESLYEDDLANGRVQDVTREELMEVILKVRGNRSVMMQDIVEVHCDIRRLVARRCESLQAATEKLSDKVARLA